MTVIDLEAEAFRRAFERAPIGGALTTPDGRFLRVNTALELLLGRAAEDLCTRTFGSLLNSDDAMHDGELMDRLLSGAISRYELELRCRHAEGHEVWVLSTVSLVRDPDGNAQYAIRQVQDIHTRKLEEGQLEYLADHDPLTGLHNRRRFSRELMQQLAYSRRYGGGGVLLVIDLDHLKFVNDAYGHHAGDELIKAVARLLQGCTRDADVVGRLGGDEFAVALPHTSIDEAQRLIDSILTATREELDFDIEPRPPVSVSIGAVAFETDPMSTATDLQVCADLAMYEAKARGGDGWAVYRPGDSTREPPATARTPVRATWASRIRDALRDDAFVLFAQPIISVADGGVEQHEILIRLPTTHDELILPGSFIYTAERFGMISELDRWVIGHTMTALRHSASLTAAVNLSGESVTDPSLGAFVEAAAVEHGIDPRLRRLLGHPVRAARRLDRGLRRGDGTVVAVDRRRGRVDELRQRLRRAGLEQALGGEHVVTDVVLEADPERRPHARLGGQMEHDARAVEKSLDGIAAEVGLHQLELRLGARFLEVGLLDDAIVEVGERVDPEHLPAVGQEALGEV
jgi:diguanylate cyclase (GGDEF)-like protein/PAS domain S-box-containing protein